MPDIQLISASGNRPETARGKSLQSVGQIAKSVVADMRSDGQDLPGNAQGRAASAIAWGIPSESIFAARVSEQRFAEIPQDVGSTLVGVAPDAEADDPKLIPSQEQVSVAERDEALVDSLNPPGG